MTTSDDASAGGRRAVIAVDLGPELRTALDAWCRDRGVKAASVVREGLRLVLARGAPPIDQQPAGGREAEVTGLPAAPALGVRPAPDLTVTPDAKSATARDEGETVRREVRLTPSEDAAVEAAAAAEGYNAQGWIVAAIRAGLANAPSFGQAQLEALVTSNRRLTQLVLQFADDRRRQAAPGVPAELDRFLREHVEAASALMASGARRWALVVRRRM